MREGVLRGSNLVSIQPEKDTIHIVGSSNGKSKNYLNSIILKMTLYCLFTVMYHLDLFNIICVPETDNNFFPTARLVFCTLSIQTFHREDDTYKNVDKCSLHFRCNF